jgi:hypothetical protein
MMIRDAYEQGTTPKQIGKHPWALAEQPPPLSLRRKRVMHQENRRLCRLSLLLRSAVVLPL